MKDFLWKMLSLLLPVVFDQLRKILSPEKFVEVGDKILDWCERAIQAKPDWYDEYLLELITIIREAAKIPDLPDEPTQ